MKVEERREGEEMVTACWFWVSKCWVGLKEFGGFGFNGNAMAVTATLSEERAEKLRG